jgi:hypothetical protein
MTGTASGSRALKANWFEDAEVGLEKCNQIRLHLHRIFRYGPKTFKLRHTAVSADPGKAR